MMDENRPFKDDGRTVADMRQVFEERSTPEIPYSKKERRMLIFGAWKASIGIAAVYFAALGALIWTLTKMWA